MEIMNENKKILILMHGKLCKKSDGGRVVKTYLLKTNMKSIVRELEKVLCALKR